ncbi:MAG: glycosyl hydrolase [Pseudomonadota bacterium]
MSIRILPLAALASIAMMMGLLAPATPASAQDDDKDSNPLASLPMRSIGPAIISGRISDFAFHPERKQEIYVATASGNVWKTTNNTITWKPIFDNEGSFAVGTIAMAPSNPLVLWVGTGENNAQRSVAYGDGVYKSVNGGKSWKNMGLKDSGHISQIWIHPEDANTVLVAAQGPLWSDGGDRGLYKTTDGGENWDRILEVDEYTGINEFVVDPRDSNVIVASSYQRRRHVWTLINGGPGSGIHRSTDGGENWGKITAGLPKDHMGRIGLAIAPSAPDTVYAIIEAMEDEQGVYRSTNFGLNWHKRSSHATTSAQYYNEIIVDPHNPDRVYSMDTFAKVSEDAGKTFTPLGLDHRHVDDHALWIDPDNTDHLYIGGDGGIYETWDRGKTWRHVRNLSIAQFYRIEPDNESPFYNICGGTQDNNSLCGPSRTTVIHGAANTDWNIVLGGDGYEPQIDPSDPNTIYAQYQYGGLARYDRRTQERVYITPHPESGEDAYKWNWNTPLIISPHSNTRLYYGSEKLFRSDDRGDSWTIVSPDLTRQIDRNELEVMGRVWSVDTIAKNDSTSRYGSMIGITESPLQEGLIYVGTDDGLISVTEDGGTNWRTEDGFSGVPDMTYVSDVLASMHSADVAYATFDNHKKGDYQPYVLKTSNRGKSWDNITSNLPERGSVHTIVEDHVDPDLLFVGTEFGVFVTQDGGDNWHAMKSGLPTIAVRDLAIQRRENDLVVGTFGRGIYIVDDYSALRTSADEVKEADAMLFPVRDPWLYVEGDLWDSREKGSMGAAFFTAPNPPFGAVFTYHMKEGLETAQKTRRKAEIEIEKDGGDTPYPSWDELRAEDTEDKPETLLIVRDSGGNVVSMVKGKTGKGLHRTAWNLRYPPADPINLTPPAFVPYWVTPPVGPFVMPGEYTVTLAKRQMGQLTELTEPQSFTVKVLEDSPEITRDREALHAFHQDAAELRRAVLSAGKLAGEMQTRIDNLKEALRLTPAAQESDQQALRALEARLDAINIALNGDRTVTSRNESAPWSVGRRANAVYYGHIESQSDVPQLYKDSLAIAKQEFGGVIRDVKGLQEDLSAFEATAEEMKAPWTPGRTPNWP